MKRATVDHPSHYTRGGVEAIDVIEGWQLGFHLGNVVKYIARADHKGDALGDLEKAAWYLRREIARREREREREDARIAGSIAIDSAAGDELRRETRNRSRRKR